MTERCRSPRAEVLPTARAGAPRAGGIIALVILMAGCGKVPPPIVPVEGIVLLEGRPLFNVEVRFIPVLDDAARCVAKGVTDKQGRFTLTCQGQAGACACENHVIVKEADIPAHLKSENRQLELAAYLQGLGGRPLPERYTNLADNPLVVQVTAEQGEYKLELVP